MATITVVYQGLSLAPRQICNGIYQEGWKELVAKGYDDPITQDNNGVHHIVAKQGRKQIGVISWYVDEAYEVPQVVVMLAYVRPHWRKKGIVKRLHNSLVETCEANGWGAINYTVNTSNLAMRATMRKMVGTPEFLTFQHTVNLGETNGKRK